MRTRIRAKRPWLAVAAVMAAAAIVLGVAYQGNATAQTAPPDAPPKPLAHLIVPDDEGPRIRVSWDAPDASVSGYTVSRGDGQTFSASGNATTFSDHTIEPGTDYSYSVGARTHMAPAQARNPRPPRCPTHRRSRATSPPRWMCHTRP